MKKVSYCLDSLITHSFVWRVVCCTINQHSRLRHFCKWLLTQDVPSQDYLKESIRTEPLMCCSLLAPVRTHANQLKLFLLMAGILCAVPQKLIWCCQAKAHWLSGVSERTVSEPLAQLNASDEALIWGVELSFESSCLFCSVGELALSF